MLDDVVAFAVDIDDGRVFPAEALVGVREEIFRSGDLVFEAIDLYCVAEAFYIERRERADGEPRKGDAGDGQRAELLSSLAAEAAEENELNEP